MKKTEGRAGFWVVNTEIFNVYKGYYVGYVGSAFAKATARQGGASEFPIGNGQLRI
jgi:hypothetical protein